MGQVDKESLKELARKYIWWKTPEEALESPSRVIAQVMNIGDYADVQAMANQVGDDTLRDVLTHAEIGQFSEHSWTYWHYRLGTATLGHVPPLPARRLGCSRPSLRRWRFCLPRSNDYGQSLAPAAILVLYFMVEQRLPCNWLITQRSKIKSPGFLYDRAGRDTIISSPITRTIGFNPRARAVSTSRGAAVVEWQPPRLVGAMQFSTPC